MGICFSSEEGSSLNNVTRSNKIKDCSSFTTKENLQSGSTERKPTFQVSRDEAETLLINAKEGEFLLSEDISSERFVSVCSGQYVSHHAIAAVSNGISVGGEYFDSITDMLEYYKEHPLGKIRLESEYATQQNSTKKISHISKNMSNSFHMSSVSSPDPYNESSDHRSQKKSQTAKSDIKTLRKEVASTAKVADDDDSPKRCDPPIKNQNVSRLVETASVSSAGYQDLPLDEPMPVLPEQMDGRPPPLFHGLSSKSLSNFGFQSYGHSMRIGSPRGAMFDPQDDTSICGSTRMVKVLVSGKADTHIEQEYLIKDCLPSIADFCCKHGFVCDVIHLTSTQSKLPNKNWALEDKRMGLSVGEMDAIKRFGMPVVMMGCFGEKMGPLIIPTEISAQDFEKITQDLLDSEKAARLKGLYEADHNDNSHCFVLKKSVEENGDALDELVHLCENLLQKCFEGEKQLWKYFQPELERHVTLLLSELKDMTLIPIERKITDLRKCMRSVSSVETYEDDHDANSYYQLQSMRNESRAVMMESASLRQSDVVALDATLSAVKHDNDGRRVYMNSLKEILMPRVMTKLIEVMRMFPSVESDYLCLRDEIYTHIFECHSKCKDFVGDVGVLQTVKAYLQGPFQKPLILYGDSGCGRSSVIAKSSSMAKEWMGTGTSIVMRLIGSTRDSTSLHLLLQSICLQLSFAYKTDPGVVPKSLGDLVQFLPNLFQFATDSQPLVIFIAGIDDLEVFGADLDFFCFIPSLLTGNVKIVLSARKETIPIAKTLFTDINSYRELPAKTVQDGIEMLDSMLVAADRTLSELQKTAISNSLTSCWSPVYVNILFHKSKSWRGNEDVSLPNQVILQKYIGDIFADAERSGGHEHVALISALVSVSRFGISKKCLCTCMVNAANSKVATLQEGSGIVSRVLSSLSTLLSSRWLNGQVVCTWFHSSIERVAVERYLKGEISVQNTTQMIVDYFVQVPNSFESLEKTEPRKSFSLESPGVFRNSNCSLGLVREPPKQLFNLEKLQFFPFYLLQRKNLSELKCQAICNFEFLYDKLRATSVGHILNDFHHALTIDPGDRDLLVIKEFFELSTDALTLDPEQFPAQVFSRLQREHQTNSFDSGVATKIQSSPPPDKEENVSQDEHVVDVNSQESDGHENVDAHGESNLPVNDKPDAPKNGDTNAAGNLDVDRDVSSFGLISPVVTNFINSAVQMGHLLMPSSPCLLRPKSEVGEFAAMQTAAISNHPMDARILFTEKSPEVFIAWSKIKEAIGMYDSSCSCLKMYQCPKLKRVLLTVNNSAVVEIQDGRVWLFDLTNGSLAYELESGQRYFAVCDSSHIAALSDNLACASVFNVRSREVVWDFQAPEGRSFHNVLVSKNGAIGACIMEANSTFNSREELSFENEAYDSASATQDEIIVVNLKTRQQLHSISLRNGQYLHKICSISEDGHYLVHLTEPDHQILVLDLIKGTIVREIEARHHRILKIMVSTQGNCVLSASADSVLRVWNLSDGELRFSLSEPIRSIRGGYMDDKHCLGMSSDGSRAVHSVRSQFHYSYVVLWDLVQGKQLATFTTDFYGLLYEISPCGEYIVTSMPSGLVTMSAHKTGGLSIETVNSKKEKSDQELKA